MYLNMLLSKAEIKAEPSQDLDIVILPAGLTPWCDLSMTVPRSDWDDIYVNQRATEPDIEPVFSTILAGQNKEFLREFAGSEPVRTRYAELRGGLNEDGEVIPEDEEDAPEVTEVPNAQEVLEVAEEPDVLEVPTVPEISEVSVVPDVPRASEVSEVSEGLAEGQGVNPFDSLPEMPDLSGGELDASSSSDVPAYTPPVEMDGFTMDFVQPEADEDEEPTLSDVPAVGPVSQSSSAPSGYTELPGIKFPVEPPSYNTEKEFSQMSAEELGDVLAAASPADSESPVMPSSDPSFEVQGAPNIFDVGYGADFSFSNMMNEVGAQTDLLPPTEEAPAEEEAPLDDALSAQIAEAIEDTSSAEEEGGIAPDLSFVRNIEIPRVPVSPAANPEVEAAARVSANIIGQANVIASSVPEEYPSMQIRESIATVLTDTKRVMSVTHVGSDLEYIGPCVINFANMYDDYKATLMSVPFSTVLGSSNLSMDDFLKRVEDATGRSVGGGSYGTPDTILRLLTDSYCCALEKMSDGDEDGAVAIYDVFASILYE